MAQPELQTREEQIAHAKELYARGYRNYVVGEFNEAAEDLSRSCELYAQLYGDESEEVAVPNLFYGKTLIELAQMGENKVLALPDQELEENEEDDEDAEDEEDDAVATVDNDHNAENGTASVAEEKNENENGKPSNNGAGPSHAGTSSSSSSTEPQPGTSSGIQSSNGNNDGDADSGNEEANENLQFAWEALEMAAKIFRRLGVGYEEYLGEAHYGLGEISMENQNCIEAIRDYNIAFELFSALDRVKERHLAEIKYKTGLCHYSAANYDASIADLQKAADYIQQLIEVEKKAEQTPTAQQLIDDLTKTRDDIIVKISDVQETKQLLRKNLITKGGYTALLAEDVKADKAGEGSSSQSDKPKANDISHLIKRKKPDTPAENASDDASPAKKAAN